MKISEVITKLQETLDKKGDIEFVTLGQEALEEFFENDKMCCNVMDMNGNYSNEEYDDPYNEEDDDYCEQDMLDDMLLYKMVPVITEIVDIRLAQLNLIHNNKHHKKRHYNKNKKK